MTMNDDDGKEDDEDDDEHLILFLLRQLLNPAQCKVNIIAQDFEAKSVSQTLQLKSNQKNTFVVVNIVIYQYIISISIYIYII